MSVQIIIGDVREKLRDLPDESVHCVVTSPPYWGLRDYGVPEQIGLERTPDEHIAVLVDVFREVRRVLRLDGTLWLNYGDCYATGAGKVGEHPGGGEQGARWRGYKGDRPPSGKHAYGVVGPQTQPNRLPQAGLKPKDLVMMPARVALALQADGWWLRSEIVWHKPNPMPESVTDRPTCAHEKMIFLLTKSERYYFDADAVREPASFLQPNAPDKIKSPYGQGFTRRADKGNANGFRGGSSVNGKPGPRTHKGNKQRGHGRRHAGFNDRWDSMSRDEQSALGRNIRNVWTVATQPLPDAHFATFPPAIVEPCIKAGCPKDGVVLDPFGGSGTVGLVADRFGRNAIVIELNPAYADMAMRRLEEDAGMFAMIEAR